MTRYFLLLLCCLTARTAFAGSWTVEPGYARAFIENKGQFNRRNGLPTEDILFAIDNGPFQVYFTKEGVTYRFDEKERKSRDRNSIDREHEAEEEKGSVEMRSEFIHMHWMNCSPSVQIVAEERLPDHFSYGMGGNNINYNHVSVFKRITYKGIYPGIDAVYEFHPTSGFKYSYRVSPGSDPGVIRMEYSGDIAMSMKNSGDIVFKTRFGPVTDHAPSTFYTGNSGDGIASSFIRKGNAVSFETGDYDTSRGIIIDPWVTFPPSPNSNKVWETETDAAGNVFAYCGDMPITLRKYSPAGVLQWTYLSSWDSSGFWIGGMITHPNGETYMCSGSNGELRKIDANGGQVWYNNPNALFNSYEYWSLAFNCDLTKLVVGGSQSVFGLPPAIKGVIMKINTANGAMTSPTVVGNGSTVAIPPNVQEVSSICQAPNGNFYFLTLDSVGAIKDDLSAVVFKASTGYHFDYYIPGYGFGTKQPISAIRAAGSCFYTQNGNTLDKRDLLTGAIVASASIPGGISTTSFFGTKLNGNGGLDIDACGNIYVGSGNGVYKFDAALNLLSSATAPGEVYDVDVSANGEVAAAGRNFLATFAMSACAQQSFVCGNILDVTATSTGAGCTNPCSGTAAANPTGGTPPYSYLWSNGATNQQVIGLCAGNYSVLVTDAAGLQDSVTVSVSAPVTATVTVATTPASCTLSDGTATVTVNGGTPPYAYFWNSSGSSSSTETGLAPGTYSVTVTDAAGCSTTQSFVIGSPSAIDLTVNTTPGHCGLPDGTAGAAVTGGTPPYNYTWAPSGSTGTSVSGLSAGSYSVVVTDASGCTAVQVFVITDTAGFTVSGLSIPVCGPNNGVAGVTVTGATAPVTYSWSPGGATAATLSGLSSGNYTCLVTDATGCSVSVSVAVIAYPDVIADAGPDVTILPGDSIRLDASGGVTYLWTTGTALSCTQCSDPVATPAATTSYCVRVTDSNGCSATDCMTVTVNTECGEIFVPNAFSPDGADNPENEKECVYGRCIVSLEFSIYDRWGEQVFQTTDKEICWDGTYKGQKMNSGVFVYSLKAILLDGTEVTKTGDITLIR